LSYVDRMIRIVEGLIIDSFVQARDSFEEGITTVSVPNGPGRPGFSEAGPGLLKFFRI